MQSVVPRYHSDVKLKITLENCMGKPSFGKKLYGSTANRTIVMIESKMISLPQDHEASPSIVGQNINF